MLRSIARWALVAGAAAGATWLVRAWMRQSGEKRAVAHHHERRHAVANWEGEGGGVAPGHPALVPADLKSPA